MQTLVSAIVNANKDMTIQTAQEGIAHLYFDISSVIAY
jgi:hypothetical protein